MTDPRPSDRKTYVPPALVVHGDLRTVTGGGGLGGAEAAGATGNPKTRMN
jgi:hypothetical protein